MGETIRIGYFAQEVPDMDTDAKVIDYIRDLGSMCRRKRGSLVPLRCWSVSSFHRRCSMLRCPSSPAVRSVGSIY